MSRYFWITLLLLVLGLFPAQAQFAQYKPFTAMRVIRTEHFDIIFPKESEVSARLLASYADDVYKEMSGLLGIELRRRLPVAFTPHTDRFNGYYQFASGSIMLFDTPMDVEWTTYEDNLKGLFIHELAHAISLNSSSPLFDVFHRIFGNWVMPTGINAPGFMVEGVAIGFESLGGFGRANDPRTKQLLRQAIYEDKFLTPFQASQMYDAPSNNGGHWYDYGGLFSKWLLDNYGMEKYAQLWQAMGRDIYFSFSVYRSDFYAIFRNV